METPLPTPTGEVPPASSLLSRLVNVYAAPGEVFQEVKVSAAASANWLAPALVLVLVGWLGAWLVFSQDAVKQQLSDITSKAIDRQIEKGKIPKEQAEAARQAGEKYGSIGVKISLVAAPVLAAFLTPFWWGLILWLVGTQILKGTFGFMKAVEVAGLANMIGVLDAVVRTLLIVALGNLFAAPSPVLFLKEFDPQNTVHSILAVFSVMTIWLLAVRSAGLARLSGVSFGRAAAWVFGVWAALTGLMIGFGAAVRAVFGG